MDTQKHTDRHHGLQETPPPLCTHICPCPFFEATPPGAAPGPPVTTGARVRRFWVCNNTAAKLPMTARPHRVFLLRGDRAKGLSLRSLSPTPTLNPSPLLCGFGDTSSLVSDHTRASHAHARPLHPAALAFVPYGIVLVRVRVGFGVIHHPHKP